MKKDVAYYSAYILESYVQCSLISYYLESVLMYSFLVISTKECVQEYSESFK